MNDQRKIITLDYRHPSTRTDGGRQVLPEHPAENLLFAIYLGLIALGVLLTTTGSPRPLTVLGIILLVVCVFIAPAVCFIWHLVLRIQDKASKLRQRF